MRKILVILLVLIVLSPLALGIKGNFESCGINIYYQQWLAEDSNSVLMIVHGLGEHSERYKDLSEYLVARNISVYALDLRGHGHSEGIRGHVDNFDDYVSDLNQLIKIVKEEEGNKRIFLLGHSLGATISLEYANQHPEDIYGLIVSGLSFKSVPFAGLFGKIPLVNKIPICLLDVSAKVFGKRAIAELCNNESALESYLKDDLAHGCFTLKFLEETSRENEKLKREAKEIEVNSCLILMGSDDKVGSVEDAQWLDSSLSVKNKRLILYDGMKHNIFDEVDNERVFSDVYNWIMKTRYSS
jgi:alpha-beta hydrolase superfamily lysophospholipase